MKKLSKFLLFLFCLYALYTGPSVTFAETRRTPAVVVIVANQCTITDLKKLYRTQGQELLLPFSPALMNIRTVHSIKDIHNLITLSTGVKGIGMEEAGKGEKNFLTGELQVPNLSLVKEKNRKENTGALPGILGGVLKEKGIQRMALGNSDRQGTLLRLAPLLTMDREGKTPQGWIGKETLEEDASFPGGVRTRYSFLWEKTLEQKKKNQGLIVIELGDLSRLASQKKTLSAEGYEKKRGEITRQMFTFANQIGKSLLPEDRLLVLSPALSPEDIKDKQLLSPILMWSNEKKGQGVLVSATTRHPGVVANVDVAPTLLSWFQLPPVLGMKGHVLEGTSGKGWSTFIEEGNRIFRVYQTRPYILYPYAFVIVLTILLSMAFLFMKWRGICLPRWVVKTMQGLLMMLLFIPPLLLLEPIDGYPLSPGKLLMVLGGIAGVFAVLLSPLGFQKAFFIMGILGWLPVFVDGLCGAKFISRSYLGYDPVIGARYYGIGNEFMGVVIGSVILSLSLLADEMLEKRTRWFWMIYCVVFLGWVLYMAWPTGGSKAGGLIVFLSGFSLLFKSFTGRGFKEKRAILLFTGTALVGVLLFVVNISVAPAFQSHIGQAVGDLLQGNWEEVGRIVERKVAMNLHLLQVSPWGKVFLSLMGMTALLVFGPWRQVRKLGNQRPYFMKGMRTLVYVSFISLLFNDAGLLAASLAILYGMIPLLWELLFL